MRWYLAAALSAAVVASLFRLGLLAYAMYVLLAVLISSRLLARAWIENLSASARVQSTVGRDRRARGRGRDGCECRRAAGPLGAGRRHAAAQRRWCSGRRDCVSPAGG